MKAYLSGWESLCASSTALRFIDSNLRGIGQVMFQDNPLSGALFFAAIVWGSIAAGMPQVAICGAIAVVVATLTAQVLRVDEATLRAGLYGFNGVLVGLALATFIAPGPLLWWYVVLGAAVSVVTMSATANALKALGVPTLTFPFVLVTWLLLLASYGFAGLGGDALPAEDVIAPYESVAPRSSAWGISCRPRCSAFRRSSSRRASSRPCSSSPDSPSIPLPRRSQPSGARSSRSLPRTCSAPKAT